MYILVEFLFLIQVFQHNIPHSFVVTFLAIVTRMGPWDHSMIRPLIRKAGKVPKEAGLDAGGMATKMKEGGDVSPALRHALSSLRAEANDRALEPFREHQFQLQFDRYLMNFTSALSIL